MTTPQDAKVARAAKLDTATLSDALDKLGIAGQCYKIKPRDGGFRMAGRAWTLLYGPSGKPSGTVGSATGTLRSAVSMKLIQTGKLKPPPVSRSPNLRGVS